MTLPHHPIRPARSEALLNWGSSTDGVSVLRRSHHVLQTRAWGRMTGDVVDQFLAVLDRLVADGLRDMVVFHDLSGVESYEPVMRQKLTDWRRSAPKGTTRVLHICVRSKLLAMGASASAIVLRIVGVELHSYTSTAAFERALLAALDEDAA